MRLPLAAARTRVMPPVRQVWGSLLDLLLPPHCPSCEHEVQTQGSFCPACFAKLNFITDPLCRGCGLPFGSAALAGIAALCPNCLDQKPAWGEARAAFLSGDSAGRLILPFKHAGRQDVVLLAGKGHETYQEIKGRKLPFLDADHAALALAARVTMKAAP